MIKDIRLKKFISKGDVVYKVFINGKFERTSKIKLILFILIENLKNVWDNINGFGNRVK